MTSSKKTIKIFMMPQEFPCGEQSSCCGPIGQSEQDVKSLRSGIENGMGCEVEVFNVKNEDDMKDYPRIEQLLQSLGPAALPILMLEDEVVSMGNPTPEKAIAAIREKTEKKDFGKKNEMIENDNLGEAGQEGLDNSQACCPSASGSGDCCPPSSGGGKNWKMLIFIVVVIAAGAVLARSFIRKSDASAEQQDTFATIQPTGIQDVSQPKAEAKAQDPTAAEADAETPVVAKEKTGQDTPFKASPALWRPELDSIASLGKVAADTDAVFIFLAADDQETTQAASKQIEAASKMIQSNGVRIAAFRLKQGAPNYENLKEQLSVPCVLAMVKGAGLSGVPADQITETKLIQAFVAASRPSSGCCPPGGGATCP